MIWLTAIPTSDVMHDDILGLCFAAVASCVRDLGAEGETNVKINLMYDVTAPSGWKKTNQMSYDENNFWVF